MNSKQLGVEQLELQQASLAKLCLDTATLSFIRVDANGHILYANPHACKDYGYSLEEFVSISPPIKKPQNKFLIKKINNN